MVKWQSPASASHPFSLWRIRLGKFGPIWTRWKNSSFLPSHYDGAEHGGDAAP